jgi:hypothetical protein
MSGRQLTKEVEQQSRNPVGCLVASPREGLASGLVAILTEAFLHQAADG